MILTEAKHFERYVAIGDSSTEGIDDPNGRGGYRGWSRRLAARIAAGQGSLLYANLAMRGRLTREIRDEQLEAALAMRPDLATVFAGSNDLLGRGFDPAAVADDVEFMHRALISGGATVLTFTLPDITSFTPLARGIGPRIHALNGALRQAATRAGAILVDFASYPVAADPRLWSDDRFHANAMGHERIAAALAHALGLPGSDDEWAAPLPATIARSPLRFLVEEATWCRHLARWMLYQTRASRKELRRRADLPSLTTFFGR